jgi:hypothetical protein
MCVVAVFAGSACTNTDGEHVASASTPATGVEIAVEPRPLPEEQRAALHQLASPDATGLVDAPATSGHHSAHGSHGVPGAESTLTSVPSDALQRELARARGAATSLTKQARLSNVGYYLGSYYSPGIGTHYIDWRLVGDSFDPTRPSMLLVDTTPGHRRRLAGFSYWVRSVDPPEGFEGDADVWHNHRGLCFVDGVLTREDVRTPAQCAGEWVDGHDLWMLHAWVVPGYENADGVFAPTNRQLCPRRTGVDALFC